MAVKHAPSRKKPTQFDVAKAANVSQTTVSLVLNNPETSSVPEETRNKVLDAIRALGYVPNSTARMLRTSRTFTLACIIPMITNPFYPAFVSGVQETAEERGYEVIIYNTHGSQEREAKYLQSVQQGRVDGVIGVFFYTRARDLIPLFEKNVPVVRLEVRQHSSGEWPLDSIFVDNTRAAYTAVSYLVSKGHTEIAMITGPGGPRNARRDGYLLALKEHSPQIEANVVEVDNYNEMGGYRGMQMLLAARRPGAVFAANDLMAIGAMKAIHDAGRKIPEEIAVVGFDDIPAAQLVSPSLTTIHQDQEAIGRQAADLLISRMEGSAPPGGRVIELPFQLVVRQSA